MRVADEGRPFGRPLVTALDRLSRSIPCGYTPGQRPATEPTALACLALVAHGRPEAARRGVAWLASAQESNGHLPVRAAQGPGWATALGVLAACRLPPTGDGLGGEKGPAFDVDGAICWILSTRGEVQANGPIYGHDTTLAGWPWATPSHSWVEPTAMNLLALKATGNGEHSRAREAVLLLVDRLLPGGGCNYGNVTVLGRELRPQVAATGLALMALAGESDRDGRIGKSLDFLDARISAATTAMSLAYGLMSLAAWGRARPSDASLLATALNRSMSGGSDSTMNVALLCLAMSDSSNPFALPAARLEIRKDGHSHA